MSLITPHTPHPVEAEHAPAPERTLQRLERHAARDFGGVEHAVGIHHHAKVPAGSVGAAHQHHAPGLGGIDLPRILERTACRKLPVQLRRLGHIGRQRDTEPPLDIRGQAEAVEGVGARAPPRLERLADQVGVQDGGERLHRKVIARL